MQAGALSCLGPGVLPPKLNHVIKPLMEAVKKAGIRSQFFLVLILYRFPFFVATAALRTTMGSLYVCKF